MAAAAAAFGPCVVTRLRHCADSNQTAARNQSVPAAPRGRVKAAGWFISEGGRLQRKLESCEAAGGVCAASGGASGDAFLE